MLLKSFNYAIRFLLELCAFAALAFWGFQAGDGPLMKAVLAIGATLVAAVIWGTFRVPNDPGRAPVPIPGPLRLALEMAIFGGAAAGLAAAGQGSLAWAFGVAVVLNYAMMYERLAWLLRGR